MDKSYAVKMFLAVLVKRLGGQVYISPEDMESVAVPAAVTVNSATGDQNGFVLEWIESRPAGTALQ